MNHNLTGCQGELKNENFDVLIKDEAGSIIIDEVLTSQTNGFIDIWLPREKKYHITISKDGKSAEMEFSTFKKDGTCITTMNLR